MLSDPNRAPHQLGHIQKETFTLEAIPGFKPGSPVLQTGMLSERWPQSFQRVHVAGSAPATSRSPSERAPAAPHVEITIPSPRQSLDDRIRTCILSDPNRAPHQIGPHPDEQRTLAPDEGVEPSSAARQAAILIR